MHPVVPGHFDGSFIPNNGLTNNVMLRIGEVQQIFYPEDQENVSKRFIEYQVLVQMRTNGTAVTKMYEHCIAIDHFAGIADFSYATFRADNTATVENTQRRLAPGKGARVLLLCINGESLNAVVLGGIRNAAAPTDVKDTKDDGHHLRSVFNGVDFSINKDGEFTLTYNGATQLDGSPTADTNTDAAGTTVKITKDGNLLVSDGNGENTILVDRVNGKVQVTAKTSLDLICPTVHLGDDSTQDPAVLGNELKDLLSQLIDAITTITVPTAVGPSGVPLNATVFKQVQARLDTMKSGTVFVKR